MASLWQQQCFPLYSQFFCRDMVLSRLSFAFWCPFWKVYLLSYYMILQCVKVSTRKLLICSGCPGALEVFSIPCWFHFLVLDLKLLLVLSTFEPAGITDFVKIFLQNSYFYGSTSIAVFTITY